MKRYLSLVLALILALAVFCGVSVSADDTEVDVNRLPTCPHLIEETDVDYGMWLVSDGCKIMTRTVKRTYMCVICGFTYTESTNRAIDKDGKHSYDKYADSIEILAHIDYAKKQPAAVF